MLVEKTLKTFFNKNLQCKGPILLAFSGGPDSLALLYALLAIQSEFRLDLHVAHVDHNWRSESGQETNGIKDTIEALKLPFHLLRLSDTKPIKNKEDWYRQKRYDFFLLLYEKHEFQALLTGHHEDDLAETVLKRIFEGADITCLGGISEIRKHKQMIVWRPFLGISKKILLSYLDSKNLIPLYDSTNEDTYFLRARMRKTIFPYLEEVFGKKIKANLTKLSNSSFELKEYMDIQIADKTKDMYEGPFGLYLNLEKDQSSLIELTYLLRKICIEQHIQPKKDQLKTLAIYLSLKLANKKFILYNHLFYVDRGRLFIFSNSLPILPEACFSLKRGETNFGPWKILAEEIEDSISYSDNWENLFTGTFTAVIPFDSYILRKPILESKYTPKQSLSNWWTKHKIPAYFRNLAPVLFKENVLKHEFLTGKVTIPASTKMIQMKIIFQKK